MMIIESSSRSGARRLLWMLPAAMLCMPLQAQDLGASIEAASRAADEARTAADAARAAADAARAAADAARAAADASAQALAAARGTGDGASVAKVASAAKVTTASAASDPPPYEGHIQCEGGDCKVDLWMIRGFRAFSQCQVCHGLDGNGSTIAPSLVEKLKEIDKSRFVEVVKEGLTGQIGVMPPWKENPNVMNYMEQLYAYLKARSDGAIPPGRLARYDR